MFLVIVSFCLIVAWFTGIFLVLLKFGFSWNIFFEASKILIDDPNMLRANQFLQILGLFIFPTIICAWLFSDNYKEYLKIENPIYLPIAAWTFVSVIVCIPLLNYIYAFNQQIMVFPEALRGLETQIQEWEKMAAQLTEKMLYADNVGVLVLNIIIICVLTGIGEEFMFRGLLQNLFGRLIRNPHAVIWVVAILFSAFHLQFYGFIPRMLLGAYLGYLLYYTKTIWIPVLAHFTNNFFSVITFYLFQDSPPEKMKEMDAIGTGSTEWMAAVSLALFVFCFWRIRKQSAGIDR
jgi:membrane protease YdiL (CAAX protease family)